MFTLSGSLLQVLEVWVQMGSIISRFWHCDAPLFSCNGLKNIAARSSCCARMQSYASKQCAKTTEIAPLVGNFTPFKKNPLGSDGIYLYTHAVLCLIRFTCNSSRYHCTDRGLLSQWSKHTVAHVESIIPLWPFHRISTKPNVATARCTLMERIENKGHTRYMAQTCGG